MLDTIKKNVKKIMAWTGVGFAAALLLAPVSHAQTREADSESAESGYSRRGADTCLACHDDRHTNAIFLTPHGNPSDARTPFAPGQLQCEACHGPGGEHTGRRDRGESRVPMPLFAKGSSASAEEQNAVCAGCHTQQLGHGWFGSVHETEGQACVECHNVHAEQDPVLSRNNQAEVCYTCHQDILCSRCHPGGIIVNP